MDRRNATANPAGSPSVTDTTPRADRERTPFQNFEGLTAKLLQVPKEEAQEQARKRD